MNDFSASNSSTIDKIIETIKVIAVVLMLFEQRPLLLYNSLYNYRTVRLD